MRIGFAAVKSANKGLALVELSKTDDIGIHTQVPFLKVIVDRKIYKFDPEISTLTIPLSGRSLPIKFNMSQVLPAYDIKIDGLIQRTDGGLYKGISLVNKTTIFLSAS